MATMTPIFHFNPEGCDDSRLDQRPITYATDWGYQFQILDERVKELDYKNIRKTEEGSINKKMVNASETIPTLVIKRNQNKSDTGQSVAGSEDNGQSTLEK